MEKKTKKHKNVLLCWLLETVGFVLVVGFLIILTVLEWFGCWPLRAAANLAGHLNKLKHSTRFFTTHLRYWNVLLTAAAADG